MIFLIQRTLPKQGGEFYSIAVNADESDRASLEGQKTNFSDIADVANWIYDSIRKETYRNTRLHAVVEVTGFEEYDAGKKLLENIVHLHMLRNDAIRQAR